jgi:hypothetical protein
MAVVGKTQGGEVLYCADSHAGIHVVHGIYCGIAKGMRGLQRLRVIPAGVLAAEQRQERTMHRSRLIDVVDRHMYRERNDTARRFVAPFRRFVIVLTT